MHWLTVRDSHNRAFTLMELIVAIVVLGLLSSLAFMGFRASIDRSIEAKQRQRTASLLREARTLYVQKIYQDSTYTWQQAMIDATADLPAYQTSAMSASPEGVSATGGVNLNTSSNAWTLEADTGEGVYSSVSSELVFKVQNNTLYVASYTDSARCVFGSVSQDTPPSVWAAGAVGSACDAESATSGQPASGVYTGGSTTTAAPTTTIAGPTISYATGAFAYNLSSQLITPAVTGSPTTYSYTGTLPTGVTFSTSTGAFTGSAAWTMPVSQLAGGWYHKCGVLSSGAVKCWGYNSNGQLGDGTTTDRNTPVQVTGLTSGVTQVSAGETHTCALFSSGAVKCWGANTNGQLGDGTTTDRNTPVQVTGLTSGVTQIVAGTFHTCALLSSGAVKCWGDNTAGQVGDGTTTQRNTPTQVSGLTSGVTQVSVGGSGNVSFSKLQDYSCAVASGAVKCWGANDTNQLGDGTTTSRTTPVQVSGLTSGISAVSIGFRHACALFSSGAVKCWGANTNGQLGDGTTTDRNTPVQVTGLTSGTTSLAAGYDYTCAAVSGAAMCWGVNSGGALGDGTTNARSTPGQVTGLTSGVTQIVSGIWNSGVLLSSGAVKCWGLNVLGSAGDGSNVNRFAPVQTSGLIGNAGAPATIAVTATNGGGSATTSVTLTVS